MIKEDLVLIGAGGHASSCIDVIEQEGRFRIAGLVGLSQEVGSMCFDYRVLCDDSGLTYLATKFPYALITVGQIHSAQLRVDLFEKAKKAGFKFPTVIAKSAYVSPRASLGLGTIVFHGAIVNAGVLVGKNCIINSSSLLEHGSRVGDHSHISTGVIINGKSQVGSRSFVGSRAVVKDGVAIGEDSFVGMGLVVKHDLLEKTKYIIEESP